MRKIVVYIATSADGFIARPDGSVDWLNRPQTAGDYGMGHSADLSIRSCLAERHMSSAFSTEPDLGHSPNTTSFPEMRLAWSGHLEWSSSVKTLQCSRNISGLSG